MEKFPLIHFPEKKQGKPKVAFDFIASRDYFPEIY